MCVKDSLLQYKQNRASLWHAYKHRLCCMILTYCTSLVVVELGTRWISLSVHYRDARTTPPPMLTSSNREL